jgi:hypothetical protein
MVFVMVSARVLTYLYAGVWHEKTADLLIALFDEIAHCLEFPISAFSESMIYNEAYLDTNVT